MILAVQRQSPSSSRPARPDPDRSDLPLPAAIVAASPSRRLRTLSPPGLAPGQRDHDEPPPAARRDPLRAHARPASRSSTRACPDHAQVIFPAAVDVHHRVPSSGRCVARSARLPSRLRRWDSGADDHVPYSALGRLPRAGAAARPARLHHPPAPAPEPGLHVLISSPTCVRPTTHRTPPSPPTVVSRYQPPCG